MSEMIPAHLRSPHDYRQPLPHGQRQCHAAQQPMPLDANPAGRLYRNRSTGIVWTLELEIGGAAWLTSEGVQMTCSMADLAGADWERVA